MDDTVVITLFRHGLTEGNKQKKYMGWNDSPLSGEAISKLSAYTLKPDAYDLFVSSDINRCLHTMKLLFPAVAPLLFTEFREMHFGTFQGKSYEDLKDDESYQLWVSDMVKHSPPEGETYQKFGDRVDEGWTKVVRQVVENRKRSPFIVTHGGVIKYLLSKYGPTEKEFWDWQVIHGTGFELEFPLETLRRGGRCISLREVPITGRENG
jgi:alpha-ribazole phosphatase